MCDECKTKEVPICGRYSPKEDLPGNAYCKCGWRIDFHTVDNQAQDVSWLQIVAGVLSEVPSNVASIYVAVEEGFPERCRDCPSWKAKVRQCLSWLRRNDWYGAHFRFRFYLGVMALENRDTDGKWRRMWRIEPADADLQYVQATLDRIHQQ